MDQPFSHQCPNSIPPENLGFLTFSGGIEMRYWRKKGYSEKLTGDFMDFRWDISEIVSYY